MDFSIIESVYHRLYHIWTAHVLNLIMQDHDRILFWGNASWNVPDTFQSLFVVVLNSQLRILYLRNMMMLLLLLYPLTLLLLVHLHTIPIPRAPYSIVTIYCHLFTFRTCLWLLKTIDVMYPRLNMMIVVVVSFYLCVALIQLFFPAYLSCYWQAPHAFFHLGRLTVVVSWT